MDKPTKRNHDTTTVQYKIEGKVVDEKAFETFTEGWEEIEGTYHCAKAIGGGRTSYEAYDKQGTIWIYKSVLKNNHRLCSVDKK